MRTSLLLQPLVLYPLVGATGQVRNLDAATFAAEVLPSRSPSYVMLIPDARACELCPDFDSFWADVSSRLPGVAWRVNCNEQEEICREITAGLGIHPGLALAIAARSGGPLFEVYRGPVERKEVRAFLKDKSGLAQRTLLRQEDMGARKVASVRGAHFEAIRADVSPANDGKSSQSWNGKSDEDFSDLSFECTIEEWPSSSLSMPSGDADDGPDFVSKLEELGMRLASADRPVMVRGLAKDGFKWDLDSLLAAHGSQTNLQVVANEDVVNPGFQAHGVWMTWADHAEGLRNGSFAGGYSFTPLDNHGSLVAANPELTQVLAAVSTDYYHEFLVAPASASGISTLAGGGLGSQNNFHAHGPVVNALLSGRKHWVILKPNHEEVEACQNPFDPPIGSPRSESHQGDGNSSEAEDQSMRREHLGAWLRRGNASREWQELGPLSGGWHECMWQCTQEPGDVIYVPNLLIHGVVNLAPETFGLVAQHRDPFSADEHHVLKQAAKLGHANDIVSYLLMKLVSKSLKNGSSSVISGGGDGAEGPFFEGEPAVPTGALQEALWLAVANGHAEAAVVLVEAGADLEACNSEGYNALFEAARVGAPSVVRALLQQGAQVNARHPKHGATALHLAVKSAPKSSLDSDVSDSMEECAEALLQGGADANAYDVYGTTPLHLAVYGHAHRMVRVLSQTYRANPLLRTTKGLKAREMCVTHGGGLELEAFLEAAEEAYTF